MMQYSHLICNNNLAIQLRCYIATMHSRILAVLVIHSHTYYIPSNSHDAPDQAHCAYICAQSQSSRFVAGRVPHFHPHTQNESNSVLCTTLYIQKILASHQTHNLNSPTPKTHLINKSNTFNISKDSILLQKPSTIYCFPLTRIIH